MKEERQFLTKSQAIEMLPSGDSVHTFRNSGFMLIGADWSRKEVLQAIDEAKEKELEIGGAQCRAMNHSLVIWTREKPLFVETKKAEA